MAEPKKTTARRPRATTRTKKLELPAEEASAPAIAAPAPVIVEAPAPVSAPAPLGEWVPIIYDGATVFSDADAGVFVTGTRTRLKTPVAARLLRVEGFRLAA